jgi:hypothetical protein
VYIAQSKRANEAKKHFATMDRLIAKLTSLPLRRKGMKVFRRQKTSSRQQVHKHPGLLGLKNDLVSFNHSNLD